MARAPFPALTSYLVFNALIISDANGAIGPVLMLFHYLRPHGSNNYTLSRCQHTPVHLGLALPVGKDLAVIVHLDLQNLIFIQPAGYRPPKHLQLKETECMIT